MSSLERMAVNAAKVRLWRGMLCSILGEGLEERRVGGGAMIEGSRLWKGGGNCSLREMS